MMIYAVTHNPEVECDCYGMARKKCVICTIALFHIVSKGLSRPRYFDRHHQHLQHERYCWDTKNAMDQRGKEYSITQYLEYNS